MLIDLPIRNNPDPILAIITGERGTGVTKLAEGVYQIGHFSGEECFGAKLERWPRLDTEEVWFGSYGVCDHYHQVIGKCPVINDPDRKFILTLTEIRHEDQPSQGGWRWHKWGDYIGDHEPQYEYLYDEVGIERVFCYHVYEVLPQ